MNRIVSRTFFVASALAAAATAPLSAQPPILVEGAPTAIVPYGDLDLSRAAGQAALQGRVRRAANRLCTVDVRGVGPVMEERQCLAAALTQAQGQIDRAIALYGTAQFAGRTSLTVAGR